jgi:hypothetical protein
MSDDAPAREAAPRQARRVSRRRFFTKVGVGGLTVAAVMFGRQGRAWGVYIYGCCDLAEAPDSPYDECIHGGTDSIHVYAWACDAWNPYPYVHNTCSCCENYTLRPDKTQNFTASAASCVSTGP